MKKRLLIVGHGRSGKDTAAEILHGAGLTYAGSLSWFALPFMAKRLKQPLQIAWERRHEHRMAWYHGCNELRREDPLFLVRLALAEANVVTGLRDIAEITAAKEENLFDEILWVERNGTPIDPTLTYGKEQCSDVVFNNGTLAEFKENLLAWATVKGFLS